MKTEVTDWAQRLGAPPRHWDRLRSSWRGKWPVPAWRWEDRWSLTLLGPCGTGKTHAATIVFNEAVEVLHRATDRIRPGCWLDATEMIERVKAEMADGGRSETNSLLYCDGILLLDDVWAHRDTAFASGLIRAALTWRHNHKMPTIVTANSPDLKSVPDERVASRMLDGEVVILGGTDKRRRTS